MQVRSTLRLRRDRQILGSLSISLDHGGPNDSATNTLSPLSHARLTCSRRLLGGVQAGHGRDDVVGLLINASLRKNRVGLQLSACNHVAPWSLVTPAMPSIAAANLLEVGLRIFVGVREAIPLRFRNHLTLDRRSGQAFHEQRSLRHLKFCLISILEIPFPPLRIRCATRTSG
jgi:hypothetical protein